MPKSYLADEPGCQRAAQNRFDPYLQTWNRLAAYREMGHPTAKVELLVLGGTWSAYPEAYQCWFVSRGFEALSDFGAGVDGRGAAEREAAAFAARSAAPAEARGRYNEVVAAWLRDHASARLAPRPPDWERVQRAQRDNEGAGARCVGLVLETRPDEVTPAELVRMRRLGATKLQIGAQSLDDAILAANRRGHDVAATRRAVALARGAGMKLLLHWMPNLLGATPASDRADFARLFEDPALRPDELKIYPCSLVETAELMEHYAHGEWTPYTHEDLVDLLADCLVRVPEWCRVTRVIRDIPSPDIAAGNRRTNLRETVEARVAARGGRLREIRAREVRREASRDAAVTVTERSYDTSIGRELFLEAATDGDRIAGFLRLALPEAEAPLAELRGAALVRELHVYGASADFSERSPAKAQHAGLGARLAREAARLARRAGHARLAVISAVGTRAYWRRLGFSDGELYQHLAL
jgi:elongator complex protein 3